MWTDWHEKHKMKIQEISESGCWLWMACVSRGHGRVSYNRTAEYAHRAAYIEAYGGIPKNLIVRHMCSVRCCVRPDHLKLGTCADNSRDMALLFRAPHSKLTIGDVRGIRQAYDDGVPLREIAKSYTIAPGSVFPIVSYKSYPHVDPHLAGKHQLRRPLKLSEGDVAQIKLLLKDTPLSQPQIGKIFGVRQTQISRISTGIRWPKVKPAEHLTEEIAATLDAIEAMEGV